MRVRPRRRLIDAPACRNGTTTAPRYLSQSQIARYLAKTIFYRSKLTGETFKVNPVSPQHHRSYICITLTFKETLVSRRLAGFRRS
jgi:hypothetical protein